MLTNELKTLHRPAGFRDLSNTIITISALAVSCQPERTILFTTMKNLSFHKIQPNNTLNLDILHQLPIKT